MITTVLPVSRTKYLDRVIESLLAQTIKPNNLLVVYDGPENEYELARNKVVGLDFEQVRFVPSTSLAPAHSIPDRRRHIANIHNQVREMMPDLPRYVEENWEPDWIFSIEDDGILPPNALERLLKVVDTKPFVGMVTGVELGRWGNPYVGAWTVDDVNFPQQIQSLDNKTYSDEVDEIDACGLYCALIRQDFYKKHEFFTKNGLGPDVNLGIFLRQQGLRNYIDWGIHVTHLTSRGRDEVEIKATDDSSVVKLQLLYGSTWKT